MRKFFPIFLVLLTLNNISIGQSTSIKLINRANDKRIKIIKVEPSVEFTIDYQANIDTAKHIRTLIFKTGNIIGVLGDSIKLKTTDYSITTYYKDSSVFLTDTISICKNDIRRIVTDKHGGNPFTTIGSLSLISALIVAPLISIDYSDGEMNSDQYLKVSGISTLISIVSLSLVSTTRTHFWLINDKKTIRKLWRIE